MKKNDFQSELTYVLKGEDDFYIVLDSLTFPNLLVFDNTGDWIKSNSICSPDQNFNIDLLIATGRRDSIKIFNIF